MELSKHNTWRLVKAHTCFTDDMDLDEKWAQVGGSS